MPEDVCLTETDAVAYAEARLDEAASARVEAHIDGCAECRWLVSELARGSRSPDVPIDEAESLSPGQEIGRYQVRERLGQGGMGVVYAAYDPELHRQVALKVVWPGVDEEGQPRLMAEARAMARLAHPGVVPIYDVSARGKDIVLAMELVDGQDAARWLREARPGWREAIAVLSLAGRGLAAAHAAELVHRDVKPANILVGKDGRARITDFGLARADGPVIEGDQPLTMTRTGQLIGTPAYMSPEQHRGQAADARSDQFGFAVLLYEAAYGARPFALPPDSLLPPLEALAAEVTAGRIRPPPPGSRVPRWLRLILLRGLAVEPGDRWPSVGAMLDALEEVPRRRRRRWLALGGSVTAAAIAVAFLLARGAPVADACAGGPAALEQSWGAAARRAALTRIAGLGPYGEVLAPLLERQLDEYAASWVAGHRAACLDHQGGAQSDELLDRRMACLERSRAALPAVAEILGQSDATTLPEMVLAVRSLPDPAACADIVALIASVPPPPKPQAAAVAEVDAALVRAQVKVSAGHYAEARDAAVAAVAQARVLGYRPLLGRALLVAGRATMNLDDRTAAGPPLSEAIAVAIEVGDDGLAVEAWARAAWVTGTSGDPEGALAGLPLVEALARRPSATPFSRALLENNLGSIELARRHRTEAAAHFTRADALSRDVTGPGALELMGARTNAALVTDDPVRRQARYLDAEAGIARLVGADHPETLRVRIRRSMDTPELAAARALLESACAAPERFHHELRAAAVVVECWSELGFVAEELGDRPAALAALRRAAAVPGQAVTTGTEAHGYLALWSGDVAGARTYFGEQLAVVKGWGSERWWYALERGKLGLGLGRARFLGGDKAGARAALEQALVDLEEVARDFPALVDRRRARAKAELARLR